jgi:hypothetical protein
MAEIIGYGIAIVVGLALYVVYLGITLPLGFAAGAFGFVAYVPGTYVQAIFQVLGLRSPDLPPAKEWPKRPEGGDPAILGYFYGPALTDLRQVARVGLLQCQKGWRWASGLLADSIEGGPFSAPLGIGGIIGVVAGSAVGMVGFAFMVVIHSLVVVVSVAVIRTTGLVLRGIDSGLLRIKNIRMICPHCYERVPYPAYVCAGCGAVHRDVRPGKYGIFRRICRNCHTKLPTLLILGSAKLDAVCPHPGCGLPMEHRPGEAAEVVLPFFGASGAGKTRLLFGIVGLLHGWAEQGLLEAEFGDTETEQRLRTATVFLEPDRATPKTNVDLPRGQIIRLSGRRGTRILHLFDAAGERFYKTEGTKELRYLDKARTFILVIDPLSVPAFWESLPADRQKELARSRSEAPSPDLAYQQTHQEMEAMGVQLRRARLAVTFSRADLLPEAPADVEAWAREELGLGNLMRSMRHNFGELRLFRTAAVVEDGQVDPSIGDLARWLLARDGVALPEVARG